MSFIDTNRLGIILQTMLFLLMSIDIGCSRCDSKAEKSLNSSDKVKSKRRPPGRWRPVKKGRHPQKKLSKYQKTVIKQLKSIGYLQGSAEARDEKGITVYDEKKAFPGYNFYISGHSPQATLMDMEGNVLHRWHHAFRDIWSKQEIEKEEKNMQFWRRAYLFENGDLLAIYEGLGIIKLDKNSKVIWARRLPVHHDLHVMPNGDIYVLTRVAHLVERVDADTPVLEDYISILNENGEEKERISLLEMFENSSPEHSWRKASREFWKKEEKRELARHKSDLFHSNTIEFLDGQMAHIDPAFKKGNFLICLRNLDMIAVADLKEKKIVWSLRQNFALQHDPTVTPTNMILLFNNHLKAKRRSSVMLIDPVTKKTKWQYSGKRRNKLYSGTCGTAAYLPNGNILITETDNGRALEVTPKKKVVWEFHNYHRAGKKRQYVASLFEMIRLPNDLDISWAKGKQEPSKSK